MMARDHLLADMIACVAMLDPILGGVDRVSRPDRCTSRDEGAIRATPLPPGWDEAVDLEADPATIPDPAEVEVPDELRAEIEG